MSLVIPPTYADVMPLCEALIERARAMPNVEIEGKLGFFDRGKFDSGVPLQTFNKLLVKMQSSTAWSKVVDWRDTQDFIFADGIRCTKSEDADAKFQLKRLVENLNIRAPERTLSLRISTKTEDPVQPPTAYPTLVRVKKRKEFHYKEAIFCFTYVWQGSSVADAETKSPRYEIEVELASLDHPGGSQYLALSLLMKLADLLDQHSSPLHLEAI